MRYPKHFGQARSRAEGTAQVLQGGANVARLFVGETVGRLWLRGRDLGPLGPDGRFSA